MNDKYIITKDFIQKNFSRDNINKLSNLGFKTLSEKELNKFILKAKLIGYKITNIEDGETYIVYSDANIIVVSKNKFKILDGENMFLYKAFKSIDLSQVDLSEVFNLTCMFSCCNIKNIRIADINITSKACKMVNMFSEAKIDKLEIVDFSVDAVVDKLSNMFNISQIKELTIINFNNKQIKGLSNMFGDSKIKKLEIRNFKTTDVEDMSLMFDGANINKIDLRGLDTSKVNNMYCMFSDCTSNLIDLSDFIINSDCDTESMFSYCTAAIKLPRDTESANRLRKEIEETKNRVKIV